ncbi:site-specific DNA-methyltransferase [Candidatus Contendibacter odensensis]|uniref:Methyltransferase n=1 Tax=Candidatus Contendobacter odensis Run_B_J11 TaxID=1400861 RepID=A0A7U7GEU4_9GAMM|nr:DNA methyltransferase [Candidatus Contendobacter odensis]CDH46959.1 putative DNA modification methylase [Candidatus Contendobacter odensis Run_B_J11]
MTTTPGANHVEWLPVTGLIPFARNAKTHSDSQIAKIAGSIREFGFNAPVLVDATDGIIAGHGRVLAARKLGMETVPCVRLPHLSETQKRAYIIADNRLAELAEWDNDLLAVELEDLKIEGFDLELTGWDGEELDALLEELQEEVPDNADDSGSEMDLADELQEKWQTATGQLWRIGEHRLYCADCTNPENVARLLQGEKAAICWTDPPWNVAYGEEFRGGNNALGWKKRTIANDNLGDQFPEFVAQFVAAIFGAVLPDAPLYMAMSAQEWPVIHAGLTGAGFHWSSTVIWAKDSLVVSRKDYHTQYEPLWYGWRGDAARLCPVEDRKQSDLWQIPRPKRSDHHPTMKPIELVQRSLENSSRKGDLVFEPFAGSGTTLIAGQNCGRRVYGIEMEPKYVACILERMVAAFPHLSVTLEDAP